MVEMLVAPTPSTTNQDGLEHVNWRVKEVQFQPQNSRE